MPDSAEALICIVGAIFLFIAFTSSGNGIHIKDITIPALARSTRYAMGIIGFIFVMLGLFYPNIKPAISDSISDINEDVDDEKDQTIRELREKLDIAINVKKNQAVDPAERMQLDVQNEQLFNEESKKIEAIYNEKKVEKIKESVESEPEKFIVEYFSAIGRRDYVNAANMWKQTPESLYDLMRNIEYYDLEDMKAIDIGESHATVWVVLNAKKVGELKQKWEGNIKLKNVDGQWKILSLAGLKNVTES